MSGWYKKYKFANTNQIEVLQNASVNTQIPFASITGSFRQKSICIPVLYNPIRLMKSYKRGSFDQSFSQQQMPVIVKFELMLSPGQSRWYALLVGDMPYWCLCCTGGLLYCFYTWLLEKWVWLWSMVKLLIKVQMNHRIVRGNEH